jgi:hypothetical protein
MNKTIRYRGFAAWFHPVMLLLPGHCQGRIAIRTGGQLHPLTGALAALVRCKLEAVQSDPGLLHDGGEARHFGIGLGDEPPHVPTLCLNESPTASGLDRILRLLLFARRPGKDTAPAWHRSSNLGADLVFAELVRVCFWPRDLTTGEHSL